MDDYKEQVPSWYKLITTNYSTVNTIGLPIAKDTSYSSILMECLHHLFSFAERRGVSLTY
jgi:hypothetical protein